MSTDDKWLDVGEIVEEFNEHAPYGLEHREASFSFQLGEKGVQQLLNVLEEAKHQSEVLDNIERLFKPLPHTD